MMGKRRILLLSAQPLLSEGLLSLFGQVEDIELVGPYLLEDDPVSRLPLAAVNAVLIVEQEASGETLSDLTAHILAHCPDLPVIQVGIATNVVHLYTSHTRPASSADLLEVIRSLP